VGRKEERKGKVRGRRKSEGRQMKGKIEG